MQNVLKEVNILQKLNHPNVCRMKELLKKELKKKLYLIMEYAVCAISDLTKTLPQERLPAWYDFTWKKSSFKTEKSRKLI